MSKSGQMFFEQQEQEEADEYYGEIKRKLNETNHDNSTCVSSNIKSNPSNGARGNRQVEEESTAGLQF
jgi:hypothetical protein